MTLTAPSLSVADPAPDRVTADEEPTWVPLPPRPPRAAPRVAAAAAVVLVVVAVAAHRAPDVLAACALIPVLALLWRRPQRGVLLLAALLPYDGMLVLLRSHDTTLVRSWKEGIVLAVLAATFVCPKSARAAARRRRPSWLYALIGLMGLCVVSAVATSLHTGITGLRIDFFYVLLALGIWRCPLSRSDIDKLLTILMVNAGITALYGLVQQALGPARLASLGYEYNTTIRTSGSHLRSFSTFVQPFPFAYFLMLVILVCLPAAWRHRERLRNRLFLIGLPFLVTAMFFSFVRGSMLGLAAGGLYLAVRRFRGLFLLVPIAAVAVLYLPKSITYSTFQSHSLGQRTTGWAANLSHLVDHPFGQGVGTAGAAAQAANNPTPFAQKSTGFVVPSTAYQPDNYYYGELYEVGVLGLWLFALFLCAVFATAHRGVRDPDPSRSDLRLGVAAFVLAAMIVSLVSTFFEIFPMDAYFWMLTGLVAATDLAPGPAVPALGRPAGGE